jgi:hypothetical protein
MKRTKVRESKTAPVVGPAVAPAPALNAKTDPLRPISEPVVMTLEEAFDYFCIPEGRNHSRNSPFNLERAVRAVAFLLHWQSDIGNEDVEGNSANGLAFILEKIAAQLETPAPSQQEED